MLVSLNGVARVVPMVLVVGMGLAPQSLAAAQSDASPDPGSGPNVAVFRGDLARTGILPGPAPGADPVVAWTYKLGDVTYATVAVVDGVVYATSHDGALYALDAETGEERWVFAGADGQSSPPTVSDGVV